MNDPLNTPEIREATMAAWHSIREFERKIGWTDENERALAELVNVNRMRESGDR